MATFIMLPDGVTGTNNWQNYDGTTADHTLVDDDTITNSYIYETAQNGEITFTLANPSVAEADIDFSQDVTVTPKAKAHYTRSGLSLDMNIRVTGTGISIPGDTVSVAYNAMFPTYTGASTTVKSIGTDWDYTGLENAQIYLKCAGRVARFQYLRVSYVYLEVDYSEPTGNTIFFGTNF